MMLYNPIDSRPYRTSAVLLFAFILVGVWATSAVAQVNTITITSPAAGTIVLPGQSLPVSVSVAAGSNFSAIQVIGEDIGVTPPIQTPPFSFMLTIPNNIVGPKKITALGIIGPDNGIFSQPVAVDVETQTPITSLSVTPSRIDFSSLGNQVPLTVIGRFSDGTALDIANSSKTTYQTNDPSVATVSTNGVAQAVGAGTTGILVKYGGQLVPVPVSVHAMAEASAPQIVVTESLSRDSQNNVIVNVTLANTGGTTAQATVITVAKTGSISAASIPTSPVNIAAGSSGSLTLVFPPSVGAPNTNTTLTVGGTYVGGSFSFTSRITLP